MIFGFNTDLRVGNAVYHVQTEDRGDVNPVIDTTIYSKGRILHRRVSSYKEFRESPDFSPTALRQRLEEQHRSVIDELRGSALVLDAPQAAPAPAPEFAAAPPPAPAGIQVQLLNPGSWLAAGTATLKLEVKSNGKGEAVSEATIQVTVTAAQGPVDFAARTDSDGHAELAFPLPRMGPGGTDLVIRAKSPAGEDEIRYSLKPKSRSV
ncbi:MAG: hypothetical protein HY234_05490 [Acidobacteria bacterium]|nr:hypothetical protein [Acidobacteriota bacterium]MBI3662488.1 hypothetical protein [Acidobacteriota bacterium]